MKENVFTRRESSGNRNEVPLTTQAEKETVAQANHRSYLRKSEPARIRETRELSESLCPAFAVGLLGCRSAPGTQRLIHVTPQRIGNFDHPMVGVLAALSFGLCCTSTLQGSWRFKGCRLPMSTM